MASRIGQIDAPRGGLMISENRVPLLNIRKIPDFLRNQEFSWQGQKDSNSRHAVLETAALPAELYPYGGPSGTRTQDRPVMSRLL